MATFFEQQAAARRSTRVLVGMFLLAVLAILAAVNAVVAFGLLGAGEVPAEQLTGPLITTTVIVLTIVGGAVLIRMSQLRAGGTKVAESLGGTRVSEDTRDLQLLRLRNVVEEMSIASGVPVPAIYVLENEDAINAFAAGYTPSDAAIAVTRGTLDRLNREELQGVIAHEYSHILNGDMRLNINLMGWLFGILVIAIAGQRLMLSGAISRNRNAAGAAALGLALVAIGYIGVLFGHMIKAAVSRSREYLADASAVQFTRQNSGLAGALKKIAGVPQGSRLTTAEAEDVSHMLFAHGLKSRLFATHPPITKRIRALEPGFDPKAFKAEARRLGERYDGRQPDRSERSGPSSAAIAGLSAGMAAQSSDTPTQGVDAASEVQQVDELLEAAGSMALDHVQLARTLRATMPERLTETAHTPGGAMAVLLALLLDEDEGIRKQQRQAIIEHLGEPAADAARGLREAMIALHPLQRVPLAAIGMPALRRLPQARLQRLRRVLPALIHADGHIAMHEYALAMMLESQLSDILTPSRREAGKRGPEQRAEDIALLFGVMARIGHADEGQARTAYESGMAQVLSEVPTYSEAPDWHQKLDDALQRLDRLAPQHKEKLLRGLSRTMRHNHQVTAEEYELLRAVVATLHCPLPPTNGQTGHPASASV
uniref:M48 family metallopeptidase n=1 Tax=Algiphilus aromaticivorans TaxID=382454 RepID=UPI0005C18FDA|nr:M48 family metallopeptidase [Algiphilus aromaticivorans]